MIHFYPLYIDPGTGSMLFSILIGATATLYFLFRALVLKLKLSLSGGKKSFAHDYAYKFIIYSEGKQYWNVFKPVLEQFEQRGIALLYLCSSEDDPVFSSSWTYVKAEYIGEGNRAFARLNLLSAEVVLMTTPGLDVYQLKRSKLVKHYAHVLHAASDATMYRLFGIDYFDSILLSGDYQAEDIRILEKQRSLPAKKLVTVGCPYLDVYREKMQSIPVEENRPFTVLISPSWGASGLLSRFGERLIDPLLDTGWRIIIRPHPQSKKSEKELLDSLARRYSEKKSIQWDYERENIFSLVESDIMISDFSGIIFDYMFLCDRPVLYVSQGIDLRPYDADDIDHELWQFKALKDTGIELKEDDFPRIAEIIKSAGGSVSLKNARNRARETAWQYPTEAGKRIADFMIESGNNA
jgi:hypothetical protein